ncbi:MAG: BrnT family toxin [Acidobacteria bacterium]|nr:BrnT family toxin [Acidobacteriota bacterium]
MHIRTPITLGSFEWDGKKARSNLRKHGVDFADAALILFDEHGLTEPDPGPRGETRESTIGRDDLGRVLVVIYTRREDRVRIISARRATRRERAHYEMYV